MSGLPFALTRLDVASYVETLIVIYIVLIFIKVIASYFTRIPDNRVLSAVLRFVDDVTAPYLNIFRRLLPPVKLGPAALDLTPMVGTLVLIFVGLYIVVPLIQG